MVPSISHADQDPQDKVLSQEKLRYLWWPSEVGTESSLFSHDDFRKSYATVFSPLQQAGPGCDDSKVFFDSDDEEEDIPVAEPIYDGELYRNLLSPSSPADFCTPEIASSSRHRQQVPQSTSCLKEIALAFPTREIEHQLRTDDRLVQKDLPALLLHHHAGKYSHLSLDTTSLPSPTNSEEQNYRPRPSGVRRMEAPTPSPRSSDENRSGSGTPSGLAARSEDGEWKVWSPKVRKVHFNPEVQVVTFDPDLIRLHSRHSQHSLRSPAKQTAYKKSPVPADRPVYQETVGESVHPFSFSGFLRDIRCSA